MQIFTFTGERANKVTVKDIVTNPINPEKNKPTDEWRVDFIFQCLDCNHQYLIGDADEKKFNIFSDSLKMGTPNRYIFCPKCNKVN